jgi:hypothetical protein
MRIASNIEVLLSKQTDMKEDINYLSGLKNKHEERISVVEKKIPENLDSRLRDLEVNTKQYIFIVTIIVSIIISILTKIVAGLIT